MKYCGHNSSVADEWLNDGIPPCFMLTITSSVLLGWTLLVGLIQFCLYRVKATPVLTRLRPKSLCFYLQVIFHVCLIALGVAWLSLQALVVGEKVLYGYMVLYGSVTIVTWIVATGLLLLERTWTLPSARFKGHGLVLIVFWALSVVAECLPFISWSSSDYWWSLMSDDDKILFGLWVSRFSLSILVFLIGLGSPGLPQRRYAFMINEEGQDVEEGHFEESDELPGASASQGSTWANFFSKLGMLWPYMWPKGHPFLQLRVVICFLILGAGRGVNLLVPIYYKYIVDDLGKLRFCWDYISIYVAMRFLQGGGFGSMGLFNNVRSFLWIRVQQYSTREIELRLFAHLHKLSLRWHLGRKTGAVLRIMDRGTTSINSLLSYILFNILPTIVDIIIAIIYFITAFNIWFGLIVFAAMALYMIATILVTEWRTKFRRQMNVLDNARNAKGVDSLLNFETVKYYGAADFELEGYNESIVEYQTAEFTSTATLNILNSIQNVIITGGLLAGSLLCAWFISDKSHTGPGGRILTVGDYVLFASYVIQLYGPLNWFGTYYRMIQQSFIDMENMFDLLHEKQEVKDVRGALPLQVSEGGIKFDHVNFHYQPDKPILRDVSFEVPPGQTIALVGHSGSGKSTIIRLLFRFYDIQSGCVYIDGQDISKVQQESLRKTIGVVPQDTVLFNKNIRYNIRYGRVAASDKEVETAADVADINKRILTFPDGYETLVGERGLKLSGGEKQRVAIARTILKDPAFVLLDEATSALDTQTERNIQSSLSRVCENRTTIIVAHRLSTIIHAHQILVLREGEIMERGTHDELLAAEGLYHGMWTQQQKKAEESDAEDSDEESNKKDQ